METVTMVRPVRRVARVLRSADWPDSLRAACDHYEAAADAALAFGLTPEASDIALRNLKEAQIVYARETLRLDKRRRPEFYGLPAIEAPVPRHPSVRSGDVSKRLRHLRAKKKARLQKRDIESNRLHDKAQVLTETLVERLASGIVPDDVRQACESDVLQAFIEVKACASAR